MSERVDSATLERRKRLGGAIRRARLRAKMSQTALGAEAASRLVKKEQGQSNQGYISKIENGENGVSMEYLQGIADALDVPLSAIFADAEGTSPDEGEDELPRTAHLAPGARAVPLISWVQAGKPAEIAVAYGRKSPAKWVTTTSKVSRRAYALSVEGQSMTAPSGKAPSFPQGSVIIVDPDREEASGALVVVRFDDDEKATFKRLEIDGGVKLLVPLNPQFPVTTIDRPATFCGVVVARAEEEF